MVRKIVKNRSSYFECEECGFMYKGRALAEKCEEFCRKYHSCDIEITKHAIKVGGIKNEDWNCDKHK